MQLALTFVFGLVIVCFALPVNSLVPVIVFHALWDMVQFLGGLWGETFGLLITLPPCGSACFESGGGEREGESSH